MLSRTVTPLLSQLMRWLSTLFPFHGCSPVRPVQEVKNEEEEERGGRKVRRKRIEKGEECLGGPSLAAGYILHRGEREKAEE